MMEEEIYDFDELYSPQEYIERHSWMAKAIPYSFSILIMSIIIAQSFLIGYVSFNFSIMGLLGTRITEEIETSFKNKILIGTMSILLIVIGLLMLILRAKALGYLNINWGK